MRLVTIYLVAAPSQTIHKKNWWYNKNHVLKAFVLLFLNKKHNPSLNQIWQSSLVSHFSAFFHHNPSLIVFVRVSVLSLLFLSVNHSHQHLNVLFLNHQTTINIKTLVLLIQIVVKALKLSPRTQFLVISQDPTWCQHFISLYLVVINHLLKVIKLEGLLHNVTIVLVLIQLISVHVNDQKKPLSIDNKFIYFYLLIILLQSLSFSINCSLSFHNNCIQTTLSMYIYISYIQHYINNSCFYQIKHTYIHTSKSCFYLTLFSFFFFFFSFF